jgi:hypothetical protein
MSNPPLTGLATPDTRQRIPTTNHGPAVPTREYQSDRASRTACRTATHPADHTPKPPAQMREINDPPLTTRSPYQFATIRGLTALPRPRSPVPYSMRKSRTTSAAWPLPRTSGRDRGPDRVPRRFHTCGQDRPFGTARGIVHHCRVIAEAGPRRRRAEPTPYLSSIPAGRDRRLPRSGLGQSTSGDSTQVIAFAPLDPHDRGSRLARDESTWATSSQRAVN